jgi:hypothetical protein
VTTLPAPNNQPFNAVGLFWARHTNPSGEWDLSGKDGAKDERISARQYGIIVDARETWTVVVPRLLRIWSAVGAALSMTSTTIRMTISIIPWSVTPRRKSRGIGTVSHALKDIDDGISAWPSTLSRLRNAWCYNGPHEGIKKDTH